MTEIDQQLADSTEQLDLSPRGDNDDAQETPEQVDDPVHEEYENQVKDGDPTLFGKLHPLEHEWTLWYDKRPAAGKRIRGEQESYESNLREIGTFGTVEDFWRYYNHLVKPSRIEHNSNYHLFKKGIKPMWEDPANSKGGKWVLTMKGNEKASLDLVWENVVLALVGETVDIENEITGAVISRRKAGDRIAVWNKSRDNEVSILSIGRKVKALVGDKVQGTYQSHEDSIKSGASYTNPARYKL